MKIAKVPKIEGCWQVASALSVSQIPKNVHRSMQPELILHIEDTGDFNSIDLMFRHHICSSHLTDPSRGSNEAGGQRKLHKYVTQYYTNTVSQVHWGEPDILLGLVSYGSEVYPMLMGKGSSTRYEEMKQRGTSFLKAFIFYSIFSYVQHGRIQHIKCRWSLALVTLTTLITGPTGSTGPTCSPL